MYSYEGKDQLPARRVDQENASPVRGCGSISTERIMQAVEERRRVSQQLEDLRFRQRQRTAHLRIAGLKLMGVLWCLSGALIGGFLLLLLIRPVLFERTINALDGTIALLVMLAEQVRLGLSLIPSSSWVLSIAALVVVLLMGLWLRLMRHPQDV